MNQLNDKTLLELKQKADQAKENSYSPYSKFRVGAALLSHDGQVFVGTNVENASYGGTICAERSAFVSAISQGYHRFKAIVISTDVDDFIAPCGFCRQFMVEFGMELTVILTKSGDSRDSFKEKSLAELLPESFGPQDLDKPKS